MRFLSRIAINNVVLHKQELFSNDLLIFWVTVYISEFMPYLSRSQSDACDMVIMSGGMGPTHDDVTLKAVVCDSVLQCVAVCCSVLQCVAV